MSLANVINDFMVCGEEVFTLILSQLLRTWIFHKICPIEWVHYNTFYQTLSKHLNFDNNEH